MNSSGATTLMKSRNSTTSAAITPSPSSSAKKKKMSCLHHHSRSASRSIHSPATPLSSSKKSTKMKERIHDFAVQTNFQSLLHDNLIALMKMTISLQSQKLLHDLDYLQDHIENRAVTSVEEELIILKNKVQHLSENETDATITAYAQLSSNLLSDLEHAIIENDFRQQISNLRENNQSLKSEAVRMQVSLNEHLARKDQVIQSLESEKEVLEFKNGSLLKAVDMLNLELEKSTRRLSEMNEKNIELCMQGIAYKNEVDTGCDKIMNSIHTRIGFVPSTVQKQVANLKFLKPPGDPKFHAARAKIHRRSKSSRSIPKQSTESKEKASHQPMQSFDDSFLSFNTLSTLKSQSKADENHNKPINISNHSLDHTQAESSSPIILDTSDANISKGNSIM